MSGAQHDYPYNGPVEDNFARWLTMCEEIDALRATVLCLEIERDDFGRGTE